MSINENIKKKKKGFTLIELIIVIAIIAILAAIAIPNFLQVQKKSKVQADISTGKNIYDATTAAIAEGKLDIEQGKERFSIYLNENTGNSNIIMSYLQTKPKSEVVENGYYVVSIRYPNINGVYELSKPSIDITVATGEGSTGKTWGEVYPKQKYLN